MNNTLLSVLVCSFNNAAQLELCLKAVRDSAYSGYELIVVDDGSRDDSFGVAQQYADKAFRFEENRGRSNARNTCVSLAKGEILVFVDADVCIRPDTLGLIEDYFVSHAEMAAVTGLLSKTHFNENFFSQYKNLYMHYIFSRLPDHVTFLYGSIHAIRAAAFLPYGDVVNITDDTALGQRLVSQGSKIGFSKSLEVIHLKKYSFGGFFRNDFLIPYDMGQVFIKFKGWRQLGKHNTGFVHSSPSQLLSILIIVALSVFSLLFYRVAWWRYTAAALLIAWSFLNYPFFRCLAKEKGWSFACRAVVITFVDHIVMAAGIASGMLKGCWRFVLRPLWRGRQQKRVQADL